MRYLPSTLAALALLITLPARAQIGLGEGAPDRLNVLVPLSNAELSAARGGFNYGGMSISLGAEMRTYLNGELALQTIVSWTDVGVRTDQTVFGALTPATADQLRAGVLVSGGMTFRVGESAVFVANEGRTAMLHRTDGGLQNVLVNTANGVDLRQEVEATLDLGGYQAFASDLMTNRLGASIGNAVAAMTPIR